MAELSRGSSHTEKDMECCSGERNDSVHRPGGERGQGISMTRTFRGFLHSRILEKELETAILPALVTRISLLLCL